MIGEKIKELLSLRGMRQTDLANKTGISKTTINSIIMRNNKNVDFSAMEKIADALSVPIEYFFEHETSDRNAKLNVELSNNELEILACYRQLNQTGQSLLLAAARSFAINPEMQKEPSPAETA